MHHLNRLGVVRKLIIGSLMLLPVATPDFASAGEKRKISGSGHFISMAGKNVAYEADNPKRELSQWTAIWSFSSSHQDWDGIVETAPTQALYSSVAGVTRHQGLLTFRHKNGDESYGWFAGTHEITANADGTWTLSSSGEKHILGGTGKFANAKGVLRYKAKNSPYGAHFDWEGEVEY